MYIEFKRNIFNLNFETIDLFNTRRTKMCDYLEGQNASIDARAFFEICMCFSLYRKASKTQTVRF